MCARRGRRRRFGVGGRGAGASRERSVAPTTRRSGVGTRRRSLHPSERIDHRQRPRAARRCGRTGERLDGLFDELQSRTAAGAELLSLPAIADCLAGRARARATSPSCARPIITSSTPCRSSWRAAAVSATSAPRCAMRLPSTSPRKPATTPGSSTTCAPAATTRRPRARAAGARHQADGRLRLRLHRARESRWLPRHGACPRRYEQRDRHARGGCHRPRAQPAVGSVHLPHVAWRTRPGACPLLRTDRQRPGARRPRSRRSRGPPGVSALRDIFRGCRHEALPCPSYRSERRDRTRDRRGARAATISLVGRDAGSPSAAAAAGRAHRRGPRDA